LRIVSVVKLYRLGLPPVQGMPNWIDGEK
jgi:hypothetical protein